MMTLVETFLGCSSHMAYNSKGMTQQTESPYLGTTMSSSHVRGEKLQRFRATRDTSQDSS